MDWKMVVGRENVGGGRWEVEGGRREEGRGRELAFGCGLVSEGCIHETVLVGGWLQGYTGWRTCHGDARYVSLQHTSHTGDEVKPQESDTHSINRSVGHLQCGRCKDEREYITREGRVRL